MPPMKVMTAGGLLERWIRPVVGGFGQIGRLSETYVNVHDTPIGDK